MGQADLELSHEVRARLAFLEAEVAALRDHDPDGRLPRAEELAARFRRHLEAEADDPPDPSQWASILKAKKRPSGMIGPSSID